MKGSHDLLGLRWRMRCGDYYTFWWLTVTNSRARVPREKERVSEHQDRYTCTASREALRRDEVKIFQLHVWSRVCCHIHAALR